MRSPAPPQRQSATRVATRWEAPDDLVRRWRSPVASPGCLPVESSASSRPSTHSSPSSSRKRQRARNARSLPRGENAYAPSCTETPEPALRSSSQRSPASKSSGTAGSSGWLASRRNATAPSRAIRPSHAGRELAAGRRLRAGGAEEDQNAFHPRRPVHATSVVGIAGGGGRPYGRRSFEDLV